MIVALIVVVISLVTILMIANYLERAPEAFEDQNGFHVLAKEEAHSLSTSVASVSRAGGLAR